MGAQRRSGAATRGRARSGLGAPGLWSACWPARAGFPVLRRELCYPGGGGGKPAPPVRDPPPSPALPSPPAGPPATPKRRELVVFVGRAVLRSASTTCWPALRPDVIWVVSVPAYPVLTRARVTTPFLSVWAMAWPLARGVSAELGTVSTLLTVPISRLTSAREPVASAGSASGTRTTTGYVGLLVVEVP